MGGCTAIHKNAQGVPTTCSGRRNGAAVSVCMWRPRAWTAESFKTAKGTKGVYMTEGALELTQINFAQYKAWMQVHTCRADSPLPQQCGREPVSRVPRVWYGMAW